MSNSEDPYKMQHHAVFYLGLHCLLRQNRSSEKELQYFFEIITLDPSIYTIDYPVSTVINFIEKSIVLNGVKTPCLLRRISSDKAGYFPK